MGVKDTIYFFNKDLNIKSIIQMILKNPKDQNAYQLLQQNFVKRDDVILQGDSIENYFKGTDIYYNVSLGGFCSRKMGFVQQEGIVINITNPIITIKNNLFAYILLPPFNEKNSMTLETIHEELAELKIYKPVPDETIKKALAFAQKGIGLIILIAQGVTPINGQDEGVKLFFETKIKAGKKHDNGSIDYKERDKFINIKKDQVIGEYIPKQKPAKGYDIFGNMIEATMIRHDGYKIGKGILIDNTNVKAANDGIVYVDEYNKLHIIDTITIDGDIDLTTGNIKSDISMTITGKINSGFTVELMKDLKVLESIYNTTIKIGGNLTVKNGIIGEEKKNNIWVKQSITADYIENSTVWCGQDLFFTNSIIHSDIQCGGKISGKGKAIIIGGSLFATEGIIANEIGSKVSVSTTIQVGISLIKESILHELEKKIKVLDYKISREKLLLGEDYFKNPEQFLNNLPADKFDEIENIMNSLFTLVDEKKQLEQEMISQKKSITNKNARIIVNNYIHEGVSIFFGDFPYLIKETIKGPITFFWDDEEKNIKTKY